MAQTAVCDSSDRYHFFFLEALRQREQEHNTEAFEMIRHCLDINASSAECNFLLGQYYAVLKQDSIAMTFLENAARLNPDNDFYQETAAEIKENMNLKEEAAECYETLWEKHPDRIDILQRLTSLYYSLGQYDKALDALDRLEVADGMNENITIAKSSIYTEMGENDKAIAELEELANKYPNDMNYQVILANMLLMKDRTDEALSIFHRILNENPHNSQAQLSLQSYYAISGDSIKADSLALAILTNKDVDNESRIKLIRQIFYNNEQRGGDSTKVIALLRDVLDSPTASQDIAELYASYMEMKKMPGDSIEAAWQWVFNKYPESRLAAMRLIEEAWNTHHDLNLVTSLCQRGRDYHPEEMVFCYYQGIAYYQQHNKEKALEVLLDGVTAVGEETNIELISNAYSLIGDIEHEMGNDDKAFEAYDSCLVWNPDNISALNNYAYFLSIENKDLDKAEKMSYITITKEPQQPTYLDTYAWILFQKGRYAEALVSIEKALKNDTSFNSVITEHAGDIYALNSNIDKAMELWRQAEKNIEEKDKNEKERKKIIRKKIRKRKYIKQ